MKLSNLRGIAATGLATVSILAVTASASAASNTQMFQANLSALNNSGTTGTATVSVTGDQATVTVNTTGASASLPHAQHIHIGGNMTCPMMSDDTNKDGTLSTAEGQPSYGMIKVSLTTSGDVSDKSGLAVDRFPTADANGMVTYNRTFTLPSGVTASDIANGVIVQHGVASIGGDKAKYDGTAKSELDSSLPQEATAPNACGKLTAMPVGGASTGGGSTAGIEDAGLIAAGTSAVALAGAALYYSRRNTSARN